MRGSTPTLHCDGCGDVWDVDYYEATASTVNGVKITATERAPGWTVTAAGEDHCPSCTALAGEQPGPTPPPCADHREVQHRDRKPPWCGACGWTHGSPGTPAAHLAGEQR